MKVNVQWLRHQSELKICRTAELFSTIFGWIQVIIPFYKINRTFGWKKSELSPKALLEENWLSMHI